MPRRKSAPKSLTKGSTSTQQFHFFQKETLPLHLNKACIEDSPLDPHKSHTSERIFRFALFLFVGSTS
ncbi:hypothetical protein Sjap_009717 [Stephania japonica]|uniref:Uncharacterized protein n=1 Tax=Stephania japonica TaxID=461633 RepID=A0AAP0J933_9MAGN